MKKITALAPGKLMLFGEHAVVYGQPCIVTAVDERLEVTIEKTVDRKVTIDAPQVKNTSFVEEAIHQAIEEWGIKHNGLKISTSSAFSGVYGFGSSAASTVATIKALVSLFNINVDNKELFDLAYTVTLKIQGVGSGFDIASSIYGGTIYFLAGGKTIEPLEIPAAPFLVGYSGVKSNTVEMVKMISDKRNKYPEKVERIFQAIGKIVDEAKQRMLEGDWKRVGKLMDFNQEYLRDLGVSTQKLEDLISAAKKAGAYGAKLSGAGGGDCMIALAESGKREAIRKAIAEAGGQVVGVHANAEGVRIDLPAGRQETTDDQSELFIVVDKDDNVLGYRTRYDCHHDKTLIHRTTGVAVFDDHGRVLLQKRSKTKDLQPGLWALSVSGHVAKGQSYEEAASREIKEELRVELPIAFLTKFLMATERETEMSAIFRAQSNGPFQPNPAEVEAVRFVSKDELPRLMLSREIILTTWAEQTLKQIGFL